MSKLQIARAALRRVGKKTEQWNRIRAGLKKEFQQIGVTCCEMCGSTFGLSFAHRRKRRFITDEQELKTVALLCLQCHDQIEQLSHIEMYNQISEIIERRKGYAEFENYVAEVEEDFCYKTDIEQWAAI